MKKGRKLYSRCLVIFLILQELFILYVGVFIVKYDYIFKVS